MKMPASTKNLEPGRETLIGSLCLESLDNRLDHLIQILNQNIKPLKTAAPENVNIRAMYIVNDRVNSHGGRFHIDDLEKLAILLIDTPVLIGHDHSKPPMARTFHAEIESRENQIWLKSYFYWPKSESANDNFLQNIDSGIYKECSISFSFDYPECSLCGLDMRHCPHEIDPLAIAGDISKAHFIYKNISQVFETSLVLKGAVKGTHITDKLVSPNPELVTLSIDGVRHQYEINDLSDGDDLLITSFSNKPNSEIEIISKPDSLALAVAIYRNSQYLLLTRKSPTIG
jgi:hypothetical protein